MGRTRTRSGIGDELSAEQLAVCHAPFQMSLVDTKCEMWWLVAYLTPHCAVVIRTVETLHLVRELV